MSHYPHELLDVAVMKHSKKKKKGEAAEERWYKDPQALAVLTGFVSAFVSTVHVIIIAFK